jgi:hypothetical protein
LGSSTDVTKRAQDDLLAEGRGGGTTVDAKIQRRLASTAAINKRMAALKRKRPQAQAADEEQDTQLKEQSSADEDSDDEDAPLPGELESEDGVRPNVRRDTPRAFILPMPPAMLTILRGLLFAY